MHVAARARLALARRPWMYWVAVGVVATAIASTVHSQLAALDDARAEWGTTRSVVVAAHDLDPDGVIDARIVDLPEALIPPSALSAVPDDAVLRQRVAEGEILTRLDVAAIGGPAARAPAGTVVVAISDPLAVGVPIGARVQIAADGLILAEAASVVDVSDAVVFVAVERRDAANVAAAAQQDLATLLYLP